MIAKNRKLTAAMVAAGVLSASMLVGQVHAQVPTVSTDGTGSAVVVPYYTVNAGWATLLNVTNTTGNSLVIKVRLHEARNSRDVLDFNVALSPYDVWTASITKDAAGAPRVSTNDTSCTIPISVRDSGASAQSAAFVNTPNQGQWADQTEQGDPNERMSEGYVEILVMGETEGQGEGSLPDEVARALTSRGDVTLDQTAWFAKHLDDGAPRNCNIVEADFDTVPVGGDTFNDATATDTTEIPLDGTGNPIARGGIGYGPIISDAPLKVNATLVNFGEGKAAGVESLHIAGYGLGENLVTAQVFPWFLEPTLATGNALWSMNGLDAINAGIAATRVINEWTSNPNTGANAEWVVTFPTKRFYADNHHENVQAACSRWRNTVTSGGVPDGTEGVPYGFPDTSAMDGASYNTNCPVTPFLSAPGEGTFQDNDDGRARITVSYDIFDREEDSFEFTPPGGVTISPAPPPPPREVANLNYEVNVLRVGRDLGEDDASALGSKIAGPVDVDLDATVGWMAMTFGDDGLENDDPNALPVTGFVFKLRDFGDPSLNFAQATEHAYQRSAEFGNGNND